MSVETDTDPEEIVDDSREVVVNAGTELIEAFVSGVFSEPAVRRRRGWREGER